MARPLSWRSAIGLPPKPSGHQRRVPGQEAEMLAVLAVVVAVVVVVVVFIGVGGVGVNRPWV